MIPAGKNLKLASEKLLDGGVVAFPTETVFGLGVVYDNYEAYTRLNVIKGRPENKPYSMMLKSVDEIEKYAYITPRDKKVIEAFLPGPLTLLLKAKENIPEYVTHGTGIIGIRVPSFPILNELLNMLNKPLLVPSANPSGKAPATTYEQVVVYFNDALDYIVCNECKNELPSTIVDLAHKEIKIIREGNIKKEDILHSLGD